MDVPRRRRAASPEKKIAQKITDAIKIQVTESSERRLRKEKREDILEDLSLKYHKDVRTIERWIERGRQIRAKRLLGQTGVLELLEGKLYQETPHKQEMRQLANRLKEYIGLVADPLRTDCLPIETGNRSMNVGPLAFPNVVTHDGHLWRWDHWWWRGETKHAYERLWHHLRTGGFAEVLSKIDEWVSPVGVVGHYTTACRSLFTAVRSEIENDMKLGIPSTYDKDQVGLTPYFPVSVCAESFELSVGCDLDGYVLYNSRPIGHELWLLMCGDYDIYIGSGRSSLAPYMKMHTDLTHKYATGEEMDLIRQLLRGLSATARQIREQLLLFIQKERLPGKCELC